MLYQGDPLQPISLLTLPTCLQGYELLCKKLNVYYHWGLIVDYLFQGNTKRHSPDPPKHRKPSSGIHHPYHEEMGKGEQNTCNVNQPKGLPRHINYLHFNLKSRFCQCEVYR